MAIPIVISGLGRKTGEIGNQKKNQDRLDYSVAENLEELRPFRLQHC